MNKQQIIQLIFDAIDEINKQLPKNKKITKSADTVLFGELGVLDSLTLVNLIVSVEELLEDLNDKTITLADERAMSQKNSPFRTIDSLASYILTFE